MNKVKQLLLMKRVKEHLNIIDDCYKRERTTEKDDTNG